MLNTTIASIAQHVLGYTIYLGTTAPFSANNTITPIKLSTLLPITLDKAKPVT